MSFRQNSDASQQTGTSAYAQKLTAAQFFGTEQNPSYFTKPEFLSYGETLTLRDENELRKFIDFLKAGNKLDGGSDLMRDVNDKQYRYYRAYKPKSQPGAKVVMAGGIVRFISDYENGKITVDFNLDQLIEEANKDEQSHGN